MNLHLKFIKTTLLICLVFLKINAQEHTFTNPIFGGDYPDPSIIVDGDTYYITFTTTNFYPGFPIYKSKDLVNWIPVTYAINKNVGSIWAPELVKHKDKYYIYFPANRTNWVIWADKIEGPWSAPIDLKIKGIDPGHFVDEKGKRYIYLSGGKYVGLSDDGLKVTGKITQVYDGWPIPDSYTIEAKSLEAPKVMKHNDYYFLTNAQGGTAGPPTSHMAITARSKSPFGPWENSPYNPIIKTWHRNETWASKGHGTPFKDAKGQWWIVYHGYEKGFYHMGRKTLLEPIEWTSDGWFRIPADTKTEMPIKNHLLTSSVKKTENFSDDFSSSKLKFQWQFYKNCDADRYEIKDNQLHLKATDCKLPGDAFPMLCNLPYHSYEAQVDLELDKDIKAGLIYLYSETAFKAFSADQDHIYFSNGGWQRPIVDIKGQKKITLKFVNDNNIVSMYYSFDKIKWHKAPRGFDITHLNHNAFGKFSNLRFGLYAAGKGVVKFSKFEIKSND